MNTMSDCGNSSWTWAKEFFTDFLAWTWPKGAMCFDFTLMPRMRDWLSQNGMQWMLPCTDTPYGLSLLMTGLLKMLFSGNICLVQKYRVELFVQGGYLVKNNKKERFSNKSVTQADDKKLKIFICWLMCIYNSGA